jgi:nicotinate phosphoribosyltransferase
MDAWMRTLKPMSGRNWLSRTGLLLTDLYQLNMMRAYVQHGMTEPAAFEFFVRHLPARRSFLVAAGLEQVLEFVLSARFAPHELDWLA